MALDSMWVPGWSGALQKDGVLFGTCPMHQCCARCEAVLRGTGAICNKFVYLQSSIFQTREH